MRMNLEIGNAGSDLTEVANVLDNLGDVTMWIFFIVLAIMIGLIVWYIKEKNAQTNKHS